MRLSKLFFHTFKEAPADADIISHQLLERGGYLRKVGKGLFVYTPLMWRVLKKICAIVREELDRAGCQEISMPLLHPAEIWRESGRWEAFTAEELLYTLKDREDHEYCLGPTHEEVVVNLISNWITSYKNLPLNLYQIGNKFRDEIRPRFGLMRAKEFLMKDGYSFSASPEEMGKQYEVMRQAYNQIFKRLGLDFAIVEAHGGKIGKGKSEEFQVKAEIGEDVVMIAGDYASNVEAAIAIAPDYPFEAALKERKRIDTPNTTSIEALSTFTKVPPQQILKTLLYKLIFTDREEFVAIGIRGDRQVNELKVSTHFGAMDIVAASEDEIKKLTGSQVGFIGPIDLKIPFYADQT
ncbi:MAG: Proline--tRNA ligase [Chlamydiae bacterium]|nr:Proline--tRNA ligase [Chlamydiota bacterium]